MGFLSAYNYVALDCGQYYFAVMQRSGKKKNHEANIQTATFLNGFFCKKSSIYHFAKDVTWLQLTRRPDAENFSGHDSPSISFITLKRTPHPQTLEVVSPDSDRHLPYISSVFIGKSATHLATDFLYLISYTLTIPEPHTNGFTTLYLYNSNFTSQMNIFHAIRIKTRLIFRI